MTTYSHTTGFTRGEVEASLYDRYDVDFYQSANKFMDNWFPDVTGSADRRPAFKSLDVSGVPLKILPRTADMPSTVDDTEFVLRTFLFRGREFLLVFKQIRDSGWRTVTLTCYRLDNGAPVVQFTDEYLVYYSEESGDLETELTPTLPPDSFDGNAPQEWAANLTENVCMAQVGPAVFITSPLFPPYRVFVQSDNTVAIERIVFFQELLGEVEIASDTGAWAGTDTLFEDQLAVADKFSFKGTEYTVATLTSQTALTATPDYTGISVAGERIGIKTTLFDTDWPRLCTFHKGRLFLFSSRTSPVGMWASKSGAPFTIIAGSTYDDSPINVELLTAGAESFLWVESGDRLILGGEQAEYLLDSLPDQPITPTSFSFYRVSNNGGTSLPPFGTDASTVFVNRGRTQVQAVRFDDASRGYIGQDISLLAPHLLFDQIRDIIFRPGTKNDRAPRIFVLTDPREMRTCTIAEDQNVIAWSRISLADGYSVQAIGASPDDVYAIVKCPTDDVFVLSKMAFEETAFYVMDFAESYTATAGVVSLDAIHHNSTVAVLDGTRFVGFFDTTTTLDINEAFNGTLIVGITFASRLDLLPVIMPETQRGATLNRKHRLVRVLVSVEEAYQISVNGEPLFGTMVTNTTTGFPRREGTYERRFLGWSERPETIIEVTSIYRAKLRSVSREVQI